MRRLLIAAAVLLCAEPVQGQNSVYSVLGIGYPGRFLSVRARSLGGGLGALDATSGLNPAAVGAFTTLAAGFGLTSSHRSYDALGNTVDGLRDTRFPTATVGTSVAGTPFSVSAGFNGYLERSFDITTQSTLRLRGVDVGVNDRFISDGGVSDMRLAVAYNVASRIWLGVSGHMISGSTRQTARRSFEDSLFVSFEQEDELEYSGQGLTAGFVFVPRDEFQIGASFRFDTELDIRSDDEVTAEVELPTTITAGIMVRPQLALRWSATIVYRTWSDASGDFSSLDLGEVADVWEFGTGLEIGGAGRGTSSVPIRFGFRYGLLPFSVAGDQPREINVAAGTGFQFAGNRASLDLSLERSIRDGAGASERAWLFNLGLTVRP